VNVLLVEDEQLVRDMLQEFLQRAGYDVRTAGTAEEVLSTPLVAARPYDVVLTDVTLPGRSGVELARILRGAWPDLKVVYMSGNLDDAIERAEMQRTGTFFLSKPFTRSSMLEMLRQALAAGAAR
jgi:DNA-binding NtrC family response regulator